MRLAPTRIPKFTCTCKSGFTGDGFGCGDVNECADPQLYSCVANARCVNTFGSFQCECQPGFSGNGSQSCRALCEIASADRAVCAAEGLCRIDGRDAICDACRPGFRGDGRTCAAGDLPERLRRRWRQRRCQRDLPQRRHLRLCAGYRVRSEAAPISTNARATTAAAWGMPSAPITRRSSVYVRPGLCARQRRQLCRRRRMRQDPESLSSRRDLHQQGPRRYPTRLRLRLQERLYRRRLRLQGRRRMRDRQRWQLSRRLDFASTNAAGGVVRAHPPWSVIPAIAIAT